MACDHDEYVKKTRKESAQGTTSSPAKKKNISEIHALLQGLSNEEMKELMALQSKGEEKKDDDEDFKPEDCLDISASHYSIYC